VCVTRWQQSQASYSLGSSHACTCSEAGFCSQNGNCALVCTIEEQRPIVRFLWARGLNANNIHKRNASCLWWEAFVA
jgi:hypothetical protein